MIHLQDNRFISPLYDFQFTELYYDDAISPMAESILQHALCAKQADEKKEVKIEIPEKSYRISMLLNLLFSKSMAALPQCLLLPAYRERISTQSRALSIIIDIPAKSFAAFPLFHSFNRFSLLCSSALTTHILQARLITNNFSAYLA